MAGYDAALVNLVDARIRAHAAKDRAVGTLVEVQGQYAYVAMDGSSLALPCKYLSGFPLVPDTRVVLHLYGSEWTVTGTFGRGSEVAQDKEDVFLPAAGFTTNAAQARRDGRTVTLHIYCNVVTGITATSGNITDTSLGTVQDPWKPSMVWNSTHGNGSGDGEFLITENGSVSLRSSNANVAAGTNLRVSATYVQ